MPAWSIEGRRTWSVASKAPFGFASETHHAGDKHSEAKDLTAGFMRCCRSSALSDRQTRTARKVKEKGQTIMPVAAMTPEPKVLRVRIQSVSQGWGDAIARTGEALT